MKIRHWMAKSIALMLCITAIIGSNPAFAVPPAGFDGNVLALVRNGKIVSTEAKDSSREYQLYLRALIPRVKISDYVRLIESTEEYHHLVPSLVSNSTESKPNSNNTKFVYQLDVVVHYGPLPITLYANVTRQVTVNDSGATIVCTYSFDGYEKYMEPLVETTRVLIDPEKPDDGVYVEDFIDIRLKQTPSNAKLMKSELSKTYFHLLSAFKTRLSG